MMATVYQHKLDSYTLGSAWHHTDSFSFLEDFVSIDIEKCKAIKI